MSRQSVRAAIAGWFAPPVVPGLNTVLLAEPRKITDAEYFAKQPAGAASGMVAYPYIESQHENQIALTGNDPTGKLIAYHVGLVLRFTSNRKLMEEAQDDFDDTVEAIVERLRSDKRMGGALWQVGLGEGADSSIDIEVHADRPKTRLNGGAGAIVIWGVVRFWAIESI
jgi:hypothetical protein